MKSVIVTGGCGFIGSELLRQLVEIHGWRVLNIDLLTYAGHLENVASLEKSPLYSFEQMDICDRARVREILDTFQPSGIIHLAAESHVDRSIDAPTQFMTTNVMGTFTLLEESLRYFQTLDGRKEQSFVF